METTAGVEVVGGLGVTRGPVEVEVVEAGAVTVACLWREVWVQQAMEAAAWVVLARPVFGFQGTPGTQGSTQGAGSRCVRPCDKWW